MTDQEIDIERLGQIRAYNEFEHPIRLADLWSEHIAVLIFVRHFG